MTSVYSPRSLEKRKMTSDFFRTKKGSAVVDGIVIVVVLFILAVVLGVSGWLTEEVRNSIDEDITDPVANASLHDFADRNPSAWDGAFAMFLVLFWAGAVILSFMIDTHPIFFGIAIILLVIVFMIGGYLSNAYEEFDTDMGFEAQYPMMSYIMDHLLQFILGIAASIVLALFAKSQWG